MNRKIRPSWLGQYEAGKFTLKNVCHECVIWRQVGDGTAGTHLPSSVGRIFSFSSKAKLYCLGCVVSVLRHLLWRSECQDVGS